MLPGCACSRHKTAFANSWLAAAAGAASTLAAAAAAAFCLLQRSLGVCWSVGDFCQFAAAGFLDTLPWLGSPARLAAGESSVRSTVSMPAAFDVAALCVRRWCFAAFRGTSTSSVVKSIAASVEHSVRRLHG